MTFIIFDEPKPLVQTWGLMFPKFPYTSASLFLIYHKLTFWKHPLVVNTDAAAMLNCY